LHEAVPGLEAAAQNKGAQEAFVQQYITSKSAGIDTVEKMTKMLSPDALDSVKKNVLANILESAAPGAARGNDAAKFSQAGYRKALDAIGDRKLEILFGKEGTQQLRNIEKVSQWIQSQPAGSAVNNSNSAAAVMNLLSKVGGAPGINIARDSIQKFSQERAANNALKAAIPSVENVPTEEINVLRRFVMPAATSGSVTATSALRPERRN
jgi:ribosome maturation factor RimP